MSAYYNENDPFAAAWLRELIKANLIAPGEVDERSIEEVKPEDLRGFTQCHFFAGIGVWSYALRNAGWADDTPVWSGSCPCQSFSASGQRGGFSDKRHLWPAWFRLIRECRPNTVFGEQVSSKDGLAWVDVVSSQMEDEGYAIGALDTSAAGVGAPHIRQRLYFVANSSRERIRATGLGSVDAAAAGMQGTDGQWERLWLNVGEHGDAGECSDSGLNKAHITGAEGSPLARGNESANRVSGGNGGGVGDYGNPEIIGRGRRENDGHSGRRELSSRQAGEASNGIHANGSGSFTGQQTSEGMGYGSAVEPASGTCDSLNTEQSRLEGFSRDVREWRGPGWLDPITARSAAEAGATRGFWSDCDWWYGRDGKYRPIGAGLFPLVAGATGRMGKLRGYGNALCAPQAKAFIEAYMSL